MSNVKIFRLNSGEEILARYNETETTWTFKDPAVLIPMQQGQIGLMELDAKRPKLKYICR